MKTKLGISVGLFGAAMYFTGFFGGYIIAVIMAGYILLAEENAWLRKTAVKAVALMFGFSLLSVLIGFIPDLIELIENLCRIFDGTFMFDTDLFSILNRIVSFVSSILDIVRKVAFIILGIKALSQGTVKLPVIDDLVDKYMD